MPMRLESLLTGLQVRRVSGDLHREVSSVTRDSREAGAEAIFVAVRGATVDGHALVPQVLARVVVVDRPVQARAGTTVIEVEDTRLALALLAAGLYGHPSRQVPVVGVTGTNGKTTTTTLVAEALRQTGLHVGRIGTLGAFLDDELVPTGFTTPEAPQLQALLARLVGRGAQAVAMEVSSIGLAQRRVDGTEFALGVFTNFTRDHLDFHGSMEAYFEAKARLFSELIVAPDGAPAALVNADDPASARLPLPAATWRYGLLPGADLGLVEGRIDAQGCALKLFTPRGEVVVNSPMLGRHNASNLLAAVGVLLALGHGPEAVGAAVSAVQVVPGRLERVICEGGPLVLVDYAHSDDALASVLPVVRELTKGRVFLVFGAGGDRDKGKRPRMGEVGRRLADVVVLTSDNPRSEDPAVIAAEVQAGMATAPDLVELDREHAIRWAITHAGPLDAVLIAGKGHEDYQEIAGVKHAFDDRVVALAALEGR